MNEITFTKLKKNCKVDMSGARECRVAILGDCATQHLATAIKGYGVEAGIRYEIFDADYDQIELQLIDEQSEVYQFSSQFILIYMCTEKLYHAFVKAENRAGFAEEIYNKIKMYWELVQTHSKAKLVQFTFCEMDDRVFGNFACKVQESFLFQVRKLNLLLMEGCQANKNVFLLDLNSIQSQYGRDQIHDDKLYYIAKMPLSTTVLPEVAKQFTDVVQSVLGIIRKCVITDLDNTLWGGVIGDDGMDGIQIGELGLGHAFEEMQMWLKELKRRGILLAVCSKNNEETAKEPFEKHADMILRMDDFSMFVANWEDKASNIRYIQETLNIGMDSIVFLDDNPFERHQVRSSIAEITVPELPEDPAMYLSYLKSLNLFETASWAEDDKDRTRQYQEESKRTASMQRYQNYDEYLQSLGMKAEVRPFDQYHIPRIAQLTQRSNQFNLRTVRCTETEIEEMVKDDKFITLYFTLKDQFGNHGLISIAILEKTDDDTLFMYNWLMSCRVLKRGMEEFIINQVVETAAANGYKYVVGEYLPTPKNSMVKEIYSKLGFEKVQDNVFKADVNTFVKNKTFIKIEEE